MELQRQENSQLVKLFSLLNSHNINLILAFLDPDSIIVLAQTAKNNKAGPRRLFSKARIHAFLLQYLNRTDRSIYMSFYSESLFLNIEREQLAHLTTHHSQGLSLLANSCEKVLARLSSELSDFQQRQQALDSLVQSLTDPQLPFPKLRKQDIGMHCNSAFQFYLIDKLFPNGQEEEVEETFQELGKYLSGKWSLSPLNEKLELDIIEEVFTSWFKVTYENYPHYLLPGNGHHNVVVLVLALLDLFVDAFSFYLQAIQDPLYSFIEFNLRFCIFRNMLLSLEAKLAPVFNSYSTFCKQILKKKRELEMQPQSQQHDQTREMTIWHCGLSKWYIYMQYLHPIHFKTYFYLLKKTNLTHIKQTNSDRLQESQTYIELQNRLELCEVDLLEHQKTFEMHSPIQDIFDADPELYSQVLKEYIEYIVDISINEYSVHWCGHSDHVMHIPYQEFDKMVVDHYQNYIQKIQKIAQSVSNPVAAIDSMLSSMVEQLDKEFLKPVTLKKILDISKETTMQLSGECGFEELELAKNSRQIHQEINGRDKVLDHFNGNAKISNEISYKYSIVLENEDFTKLLKTSASTNASYISQGCIRMQSIKSSDSIMEEDFI